MGDWAKKILLGAVAHEYKFILIQNSNVRFAKTACFVAGTKVWLHDYRQVNIEDVHPYDTVRAFDTNTQREVLGVVTHSIIKQASTLIGVFTITDTLWVTPEHPFYINGEWIPAGRLKKGQRLTLLNHSNSLASRLSHLPRLEDVYIDSIATKDTLVTVYNFTVAKHHNYYVGNLGVLVHNNDCIIENAVNASAEIGDGQQKKLSEITKSGVKYFFRGTNVSIPKDNSIDFDNPFVGNPNSQTNGASTSLDPAVSLLFAMESLQDAKNAAKPYIYIATKNDLKNINAGAANRRVRLEAEVVLKISPLDFAPKASIVISVENALEILRGLNLHHSYNITERDVANTTMRLQDMQQHRIPYKKVEEFYKKALEVNLKGKDKEIIIKSRDGFNRYFGVKPSKLDWKVVGGKLKVLEVASGVSSYNHLEKRLKYSRLLNGVKRTRAMKQRTASHELGHVYHYYKNLVTPQHDPSLDLQKIFNDANQRIKEILLNPELAAKVQFLQRGGINALRRYSPKASLAELSQQLSSVKDVLEAASFLQIRFLGVNSRSDHYWNQYPNHRKLYMEFMAIAFENKMVGNSLFKGLFPKLFKIVTRAGDL